MSNSTLLIAIIFITLSPLIGYSQTPMEYIHHGAETVDDKRYFYHWRILKAALQATINKYGPYTLTSVAGLTEKRQEAELLKGDSGTINTMILDLASVNAAKIRAVHIPIDKGLLGYRVFLIRAEDQGKIAEVQNIDDLKRNFRVGQGTQWIDFSIYEKNGFKVAGSPNYEHLFGMLASKRFDLLGRGVTEVNEELKVHSKKFPNIVIEKSLLIYYPIPMYFMFPKTLQGEKLATRVEDGLLELIKNGQFDKLFYEEFSPLINALNLKNRRLFILDNPFLPSDKAYQNKKLWFTLEKKN